MNTLLCETKADQIKRINYKDFTSAHRDKFLTVRLWNWPKDQEDRKDFTSTGMEKYYISWDWN